MSTICLYGTTCYLDWDGVNAVATFAAAAIALGASYTALRASERAKAIDRSDATLEIIRAAAEALRIFQEALDAMGDHDVGHSVLLLLAPQADLQRRTIRTLLRRPELTDGGVFIGCGAIDLLEAIPDQIKMYRDRRPPNQRQFARVIPNRLKLHETNVRRISDRAKRVANYAVDRGWPKARQRFAGVARNGLVSDEEDQD